MGFLLKTSFVLIHLILIGLSDCKQDRSKRFKAKTEEAAKGTNVKAERVQEQEDPPITVIPENTEEAGPFLICHDKDDGHDIFLDYYKYGLPKYNYGQKKRVIIIGAGMSGLAAGKLLKDAGHDVILLEALSRAGGRLQTYRSLEEGWLVEFGPMRYPRDHRFTIHLAEQARVLLTEFNNESSPFHFYVQDEKLKKKNVNDPHYLKKSGSMSLPMIDGVPQNPEKLFEEAMEKPVYDLEHLPWKEFVSKYDGYSLKEWLYHHFGFASNTVEQIAVFLNIEAFMDLSLVEGILEQCIFSTDRLNAIGEGVDRLTAHVLEEMEEFIEFKARVVKVERTNYGEVKVSIQCNGICCGDQSSEYWGDVVLLSTTAEVGTTIQWEPPLSVEKETAMRKVHYTSSTKVILVFHHPFWEEPYSNGALGGNVAGDLPLKILYYPYVASKTGVGVLLASYVWGDDSLRFAGMSEDDIIKETLEGVAELHGMSFQNVSELFIRGVVKRWTLDENTLGAFLSLYPYQFALYQDELSMPETDQIFFCGEHTENPHGWIDTAIKSGVRAAAQIHLGEHFSRTEKPEGYSKEEPKEPYNKVQYGKPSPPPPPPPGYPKKAPPPPPEDETTKYTAATTTTTPPPETTPEPYEPPPKKGYEKKDKEPPGYGMKPKVPVKEASTKGYGGSKTTAPPPAPKKKSFYRSGSSANAKAQAQAQAKRKKRSVSQGGYKYAMGLR